MKKTVAPCFLPNALPGFELTPVPAETLTVGRHAKCKPSLPQRVLLIVAALTVGFLFAPLVVAEEVAAPHWVGTWSSSPQPIWGPDFIGGLKYPRNLWNQTVRQLSRVSIGGPRIRVVLSNEYGQTPVAIGAARVALSEKGSAIVAGSDRALNFGGRETVTIPPGAAVLSDPVDLTVAPLGSVAISLYLPDVTPVTTWHNDARQTAFLVAGNKVSELDFKPDASVTARVFVSQILVDAPPAARAIVAFGDSITDGDGSTVDANHRWPDVLAARFVEAGTPVGVLNAGISGAKLLKDRMGVNALARFDRDALSIPGVETVVVMIGINDIGWPGGVLSPTDPPVSVDDLIMGYRQLIAQAHARNIRIIGATLTPFEDTFKGVNPPLDYYYSPEKEKTRQAVNKWIREGKEFDGVIDFDALARDPQRPSHIQAAFDSGDHLHPGDTGYKAMADSIDLKMLTTQP
ncbi:MAG TPA: SGNH/GDSL hydrolase family protein [Chthoniobacterales bacterium]|jgi:lysophospholipase L1-like esterase|nr:SGNH/GDSL hydrolase family protein [Chthoniobacterales bacterium]